MPTTTQPYEFLARWNTQTGALGMHYLTADVYKDEAGTFLFDKIGSPQPVAAGSDILTEALSALNTTALAQVQDLTAQLATAKSDAQAATTKAASDLATAQTALSTANAQVEQLQAQLAAVGTPVPVAAGDVLSKLNAAFEAAIPPDARPAFAEKYAIVRTLVQAGQMDMARHVIEQTPVPAELEAAKTQLLTFFALAS